MIHDRFVGFSSDASLGSTVPHKSLLSAIGNHIWARLEISDWVIPKTHDLVSAKLPRNLGFRLADSIFTTLGHRCIDVLSLRAVGTIPLANIEVLVNASTHTLT